MKKLITSIVLGAVLVIGASSQVIASEDVKVITKDDPGIMQPMSGGTKPPVTERP